MHGVRILRPFERPFLRLALIGALTATLGLAACGRKGPLDPPPAASVAGEQTPAPEGRGGRVPIGPDGKPIASGNVNKRIPLDVLLN
jgi:predicted small lipoprotein YifL